MTTYDQQGNFDAQNNRAQYDVSVTEMQSRVKDLLVDRPPHTASPIICYEVGNDNYMGDVARTIERVVFEKRFGNDTQTMAKIYGPYEASSSFFLSIDQSMRYPVGALRVISNSQVGLMTLNSLPDSVTDMDINEIMAYHNISSLNDCWDIGTIAVMPEYRQQGKGVSLQLYRAMYKAATNGEIKHLLSIIDKVPHDTMTKYLGIPFEPLAGSGPFEFEGSKNSIAVHGFVPDFYKKMKRKSKTAKGLLARKALRPLVFGTEDHSIELK